VDYWAHARGIINFYDSRNVSTTMSKFKYDLPIKYRGINVNITSVIRMFPLSLDSDGRRPEVWRGHFFQIRLRRFCIPDYRYSANLSSKFSITHTAEY
jgi:hypothetical protein